MVFSFNVDVISGGHGDAGLRIRIRVFWPDRFFDKKLAQEKVRISYLGRIRIRFFL